MADHPTYQIRPLSREEMRQLCAALEVSARNWIRIGEAAAHVPGRTATAQCEAAKDRTLARELLSTMGAADDARKDAKP
jgi:hypothetical protein